MSYFGGTSGNVGDPGFFDTFKKIGGAIFGATPLGRGIQAVRSIFPTSAQGLRSADPIFTPPVFGRNRIPLTGARFTPLLDANGMPRKRRRMNVGNVKALRRATRRTDGFVRLARSSLKNTGFKVVSKSAGKVSRAAMDKAVAKAHHQK